MSNDVATPSGSGATGGDWSWARWVARAIGGSSDRQAMAMAAIEEAIASGAATPEIELAARQAAGERVDAAERLRRLAVAAHEAAASGQIAEGFLASLAARRTVAEGVAVGRWQTSPDRCSVAAARLRSGAAPPAGRPVPGPAAAPSLTEYLGTHAIQLIAYTGAFLLLTATILFELYGASHAASRFAGVLALNAVFAAVAIAGSRNRWLRVMAPVYTALAALLAPLTLTAGYVFLDLAARGLSQHTALVILGISSFVLYSALALTLGSRAYALLAMAAPGFVVFEAFTADTAGWMGVGFAMLTAAYGCVRPGASRVQAGEPFAWGSEPFVHASALAAISEATVSQVHLTAALAVLTAAYLIYCLLARRPDLLWLPGLSLTLTLAAPATLAGQWQRLQVELTVLAWAYALSAVRPRVPASLRAYLLAGAAVQAGLAVAVWQAPGWQESICLSALALLFDIVARAARQPWWGAAAALVLTADWYWLSTTLLPLPEHGRAGDLLPLLYAPLPIVLLVAGLVLRWRRGAAWGTPVFAVAGTTATVVACWAGLAGDTGLMGRSLAVYAAAIYGVGALQRWPLAVGAATAVMAAAAASLLFAASAPAGWYAVALGAVFVGVYALRFAWPGTTPAWIGAHRTSALVGQALLVAWCLLDPGYWQPHAAATLGAIVTAPALAALLRIDTRLGGSPWLEHASLPALALTSFWLLRYIDVNEPEWYALPPGLSLVVVGIRLPLDRRVSSNRTLASALTGIGVAVALMELVLQSLQNVDAAGGYVAWLVIGGVVAILTGIAARNRALVVAGGVATAVSAVRALVLLVQVLSLWKIFGLTAVVLLLAAALLAALRERLGHVRHLVAAGWTDWN